MLNVNQFYIICWEQSQTCVLTKNLRDMKMKKLMMLLMCGIAANMGSLAADEVAANEVAVAEVDANGGEVADCCKPKCCKPSCHKECHCPKPCCPKPCEKPCHKPCEKPCEVKKPCCPKPCEKSCDANGNGNMDQDRASRGSFENSLSSSQRRQYNNFSDSQRQRAMDMSRDMNMSPNQAVDKVAAGG